MGSTPYLLPQPRPFRARYIRPDELSGYGLPADDESQPNLMALIDAASTFIDEYCGRTDGNGQGSLTYSTYKERILLQSPGRNLFRVMFKPMAVVLPNTVTALTASASQSQSNSPLFSQNWFYTGCKPNTVTFAAGSVVSPIISASGRYGYPRRGETQIYPDLNYGINPLQIASYFGGPPTWTAIDPSAIDFDTATGECWIPAGLYLSRYTEVWIEYNAGYSPILPAANAIPGAQQIPNAIRQACVGLVKNFLARAGGTFALKSISAAGSVNYTFNDADVDPTIERFLMNHKRVTGY